MFCKLQQENLSDSVLIVCFAFLFVRPPSKPPLAFLSLLLKDIRSERPKITEKDNLRLLFVTKWFLEFFLSAKEKNDKEGSNWSPDFPMVAQVVDRTWIVWVLRRMRGALDEKVR